jgi:D-arabinose 1-dehydrogenase-like Zn-dependent alcohol dehydrogenase
MERVDLRRSTPPQRRAWYLEPLGLDERRRAITLVAGRRVKTVVDRVKPLEELNAEFDALQAGDVVERVVLDAGSVW